MAFVVYLLAQNIQYDESPNACIPMKRSGGIHRRGEQF